MEARTLSQLKVGELFLTTTSELYVVDYHETDGKVLVRRYADKYYCKLLKGSTKGWLINKIQ